MVEKVHGDSDQTGAAEVEPMIAFKYQMSQWRDIKGKHHTCCTIDNNLQGFPQLSIGTPWRIYNSAPP